MMGELVTSWDTFLTSPTVAADMARIPVSHLNAKDHAQRPENQQTFIINYSKK